jgi:hypothetical protein
MKNKLINKLQQYYLKGFQSKDIVGKTINNC